MHFFNDLQVDYKTGNKKEYSGRASIINNEYWHQIIKVAHIKDLGLGNTEIGIIGYVCDEGVKRNQGRVGAKQGPASLRNTLGKLPIHFNTKEIVDFGNVICSGNYLEDCQKAFSRTISKLIKNKILPIGIGGGHDIAYAHFNGIKDALKLTPKNKIGIINFDAHFDLRPVEDSPNSGTPFYQILKEHTNSSYFAIGIQQQANTKTLFEIAAKNKVTYVSNLDCETFTERLKEKLKSFIEKVDYLYVTIDLDGFSSAYAPGVSAPSPAGFTPHFVFKVLENIFQSKKVISCDIAELNPTYDIDNHTATLAARFVDFMVSKA